MLVYAYITGIHMFKHITSVIRYHTGTKYILTYYHMMVVVLF